MFSLDCSSFFLSKLILDETGNVSVECKNEVLFEQLNLVRKGQDESFQLQTEAFQTLRKVLDEL